MTDNRIADWLRRAIQAASAFGNTDTLLAVSLPAQQLVLLAGQKVVASYAVSTSRYGAGCVEGSRRTPLGVHRIAEKIGAGCPRGTIFKARRATGEIADIIVEARATSIDVITSRILWLEGLEPGLNSGPGVDSHARYIYIHGTAEEGLIGQPASIGCIRMRNDDVMELFENVNVGTLLFIQ